MNYAAKTLQKRFTSNFFRIMSRFSSFMIVMIAALLISKSAYAQIPAEPQTAPVALTGGTVHTLSDQGVVENGVILFENGVISDIGASLEIPDDAIVMDVSGRHIYPGLIDAWNNMGIFEIGAVTLTVDTNEQGDINPNVMVERAFNAESRHIGVARSAGVLTSVTTPNGGLISGQSAAMKMDGWSWDEMTLKSGAGLIVNWPNPVNQRNYNREVKKLRGVFADARAYHIARKAMDEGNTNRRHAFDSRWHAMIPVFEGEVPVVVNANEVRQIQDAITWAEEENVRLIILGGNDAHLVGGHLVEKDIPVILTTVLSSPFRWWESYDTSYELPAKLHEAGVLFAIAGSYGAANVNRLPFEAGAAAAFGLPVEEALKALTVHPAKILGLDDRIGTLEPGKDATLLITTGNPIEYSTQVEQVFVQGRMSDMMDMHRQFYEKYSEKVRQWEEQR